MDQDSLKVNKKAKKERHDKIFCDRPSWLRLYHTVFKRRVCPAASKAKKRSAGLNEERHRTIAFWKCLACCFAWFLMQGILPTYAFVHAAEEYDQMDFLAEETENGSELINSTEDGFIFKIAGQSEQGNRTLMSDVTEYEVQEGDSLSSIAQKFNISKQTITWNNNFINGNNLKVGQKLAILPVNGVLHTVKKGDTLAKIAKKYKIASSKTIVKQNDLESGKLVANQQLIVPGGKIEIPRDYIAYNRGNSADRVTAGNILGNPNAAYNGNLKTMGFIKPTNGIYTKRFRRGHYAVDIANRSRGPIFASADGVVTKSQNGWNGGYGNMITLNHPDKSATTLYAHLQERYVKVGDHVKQGQVIGWMGNTGRVYGATGIHLHFEISINGVKRNPLAFF